MTKKKKKHWKQSQKTNSKLGENAHNIFCRLRANLQKHF